MHACKYTIHTYIRTHAHTHVCTYKPKCVPAQVDTQMHSHICSQDIHIYMPVYIYIQIIRTFACSCLAHTMLFTTPGRFLPVGGAAASAACLPLLLLAVQLLNSSFSDLI